MPGVGEGVKLFQVSFFGCFGRKIDGPGLLSGFLPGLSICPKRTPVLQIRNPGFLPPSGNKGRALGVFSSPLGISWRFRLGQTYHPARSCFETCSADVAQPSCARIVASQARHVVSLRRRSVS